MTAIGGMAAISRAISSARGKRLAGRRHLADHAHAQRFGGAEHPAGHQQQHGALAADQARQFLRAAAAGQDADLDFGQAEAGALAGDDDVGAQRQLQPAAERKAFDRGDHRLRTVA